MRCALRNDQPEEKGQSEAVLPLAGMLVVRYCYCATADDEDWEEMDFRPADELRMVLVPETHFLLFSF